MGRASRAKQERRTAGFAVRCQGILEVLSIGKGDLKITVGDSARDRADAQRLIEEMLRKGYTLFVETSDGPLRVRKFDPDRMVYVVADTPDVLPSGRTGRAAAPHRRAPRTIPVGGSRTTAIGRTAGG